MSGWRAKKKNAEEQKGKTLIDDRKGQLKARALHRLPPPSVPLPCGAGAGNPFATCQRQCHENTGHRPWFSTPRTCGHAVSKSVHQVDVPACGLDNPGYAAQRHVASQAMKMEPCTCTPVC